MFSPVIPWLARNDKRTLLRRCFFIPIFLHVYMSHSVFPGYIPGNQIDQTPGFFRSNSPDMDISDVDPQLFRQPENSSV
jgi:hypothetical protein